MSNLTHAIQGRDWRSGRWIEVTFDHATIQHVRPTQPDPLKERWLAPGMVDLQINGYGGIDFQQEETTEDDLLKALSSLARDGCSRCFLTLITAPWDTMMKRLKRIKRIRDTNPILRASIAGWHLEGPFLSETPGYCGAHHVPSMSDPSIKLIQELRNITLDDPVLLTLAPERPGSMEAIKEAARSGLRVSLGHTDANAATLACASDAGASGFTHLGNACPQQLDRHDNQLFRALDSGPWFTGLIPDKMHVSPTLFRILHRLIPGHRIYYTTDAMSGAGAEPGHYTIGHLELEIGEDQIVRQPGKTNFAGSALSPREGIERAAAMLGVSWREVWQHFSEIPARWMELPTGLDPGSPSSFCIIEAMPDTPFNIQTNPTWKP